MIHAPEVEDVGDRVGVSETCVMGPLGHGIICLNIFEFLEMEDLLRCGCVCTGKLVPGPFVGLADG